MNGTACTLKRLLVTLVCLALLGGCTRAPEESRATRKTTEEGPLRLTVEARPASVAVGDRVTITLSFEVPPGAEPRLPDVLGDLRATLAETPAPQPGPSGVLYRRVFVFEPLTSGLVEIPAVTATCRVPAADSQPAGELAVTSAPLAIEVRTALTDADAPTRPRAITGTLMPPVPPLPWWVWVAGAGGALGVLAATAGLVYWLIRRAARPPPPVLPEVWALRALEALAAEDCFATGRVREFYYRLTEVVRAYIERKFGLAAPEMTTEEFLATLARDRRALPYDAERLREFLEQCDVVKYAAATPRPADADDALATARAFIHATAAAADERARASEGVAA